MTKFDGFVTPEQNWSKLPHAMIDALPLVETIGEMKVIFYILRHTWGYQEFGGSKKITLDEFEHGRKQRNGERMDNGVGLSRPTIIDGLRRAEEHGFIEVEVDESDAARVKKFYTLRMSRGKETLHRGKEVLHPGGKEVLHRTEKDTLERNPRKNSADAEKPENPQKPSAGQEAYESMFGQSSPPAEEKEPPRSAADHSERIARAMNGFAERREREPWRNWRDVRARGGIRADQLQHVGWLIEQQTNMRPADGEMKGWTKALAMIYQVANGDFDLIKEGVAQAWEREIKFRPTHARGFVGEVRKLAATHGEKLKKYQEHVARLEKYATDQDSLRIQKEMLRNQYGIS